jgi:hypothetical protein
VLFGGFLADAESYQDTWTFDGAAWTEITTLPKPPGRQHHSVTWDAVRRKLVMFGGETKSRIHNDTWLFDGTSWAAVTAGQLPPARYFHRTVWDDARGQVVLFGGFSGAAPLGDTWLFNGAQWLRTNSPDNPPPRYNYSLAWNAKTQEVVAFGGSVRSSELGDTWRFDGIRWFSILSAKTPTPRDLASLVWDPARAKLTLFGGRSAAIAQADTWTLDGQNWDLVAAGTPPTARAYHSLTWDESRGVSVLFGGQLGVDGSRPLADTWTFDGSVWLQLLNAGTPPARAYHEVVRDDRTGNLVMFGGYSREVANGFVGDTWIFNGTTWSEALTANTPPPRYRHAFSWNPTSHKGVLFGGRGRDAGGTLSSFNDTWLFDGTNWSAAAAVGAPPPRFAPAFAWHPILKEHVLFGGAGPVFSFADTWTFDGVRWRKVTSQLSPPSRTYGKFAWDSVRGKLILFGGDDPGGRPDDTWAFDGSEWTRVVSTIVPPGRFEHALSWDAARQSLVVFGGFGVGGTPLADAWLLDKNGWQSIADFAGAFPAARAGHAMLYDPLRRRHVVTGGLIDATATIGDSWTLHLRGGACARGADCGSGFCVDSVCCEGACGACETCNGVNPGKCTPVTNAEDPDSCSAKTQQFCNARGKCSPGLGAQCNANSDCASGFCAEGVCCNEKCDGACRSCSATDKIDTINGTCGVAKALSNPGGRCLEGAVCGNSGTCDRGGSCKDDHTAVDTKGNVSDCGRYRCASGLCGKTCVDLTDCISPAVCTQDSKCISVVGAATTESGCCATTPNRDGNSNAVWLVACSALSALTQLRRAQRRRR